MPPKETIRDLSAYLDGERVELPMELTKLNPTPSFRPIGDLHSVPHYRCGLCHCAIVIYEDDEKLGKCPWCGCIVDWEDEYGQGTETAD